jgi:hypothetical protein
VAHLRDDVGASIDVRFGQDTAHLEVHDVAGAEIVRAGVSRAGVDGDQVGPGVEGGPQRRLGVAVAKQPERCVDGDRLGHRRGLSASMPRMPHRVAVHL